MKIQLKNFGVLKEAEIDLSKDLIILTGPNNTGKSYMANLVYGFYRLYDFDHIYSLNVCVTDKFSEIIDDFNNNSEFKKYYIESDTDIKFYLSKFLNKEIHHFTDCFDELIKRYIYEFFSSSNSINNPIIKLSHSKEDLLLNKNYTEIKISKNSTSIDDLYLEIKEYIIRALSKVFFDIFNKSIFFPAERSAIHLFSKEIIQQKSLQRHNVISNKSNIKFLPELNSRDIVLYPLSINDYLYFVNNLEKYALIKNAPFRDIAENIEKQLLGGTFSIGMYNEVKFNPNNSKESLSLQTSSSTVKSLVGLVFYFKYLAFNNDVIFIDEPELNLHPDNQRLIARIIASAVNRGIKVIISTHSDYFTREINNLIRLKSNEKKAKKLLAKYNYTKDELLDFNKVGAYLFNENTNILLDINETGFEVPTIDGEITDLNNVSEDIYFSLFE
ncbi:MAG: hypothetical protein A2033_14645 [Bacteroidetes bacterium GWA2_31_9]|nr:MAG: hypothetical protein A2033_14645 [Bacteroidetes bacterium GWA2_31_9]